MQEGETFPFLAKKNDPIKDVILAKKEKENTICRQAIGRLQTIIWFYGRLRSCFTRLNARNLFLVSISSVLPRLSATGTGYVAHRFLDAQL
jgi:hypothetical protein